MNKIIQHKNLTPYWEKTKSLGWIINQKTAFIQADNVNVSQTASLPIIYVDL